jgi:hypothetical protein
MLYVFDMGKGSKLLPVYYFSMLKKASAAMIQEEFLFLEDLDAMGGCEYIYLGSLNDPLSI